MRIALLADIHGNLEALKAVIDDLSHRHVQRVVNLGDHASGPLFPLETTRLLMAQDWIHLAGNHERQLLTLEPGAMNLSDAYTHAQLGEEELAWMSSQTSCRLLEDDMLLCHGTPSSDSTYFLETVLENGHVRLATPDEIEDRLGNTHARLIACGHTHIPRSVRTTSGRLIVNPGSVGLPACDDVSPCHHILQTGSPDARYAIVEKRREDWLCELISVPYDYRSTAEAAEKNGRADWATALRTGSLMTSDTSNH